jgi:hypothetical protein
MAIFSWIVALATLTPASLATLSAREAIEAHYAAIDAVSRPWMAWADETAPFEFQPNA